MKLDNFKVGARYYGIFDNMFIEATTTATTDGGTEQVENADGDMEDVAIVLENSEYNIGAAIGWTLDTGIWKFQFEPMIVLDNIQDFTPRLAWALRFTL